MKPSSGLLRFWVVATTLALLGSVAWSLSNPRKQLERTIAKPFSETIVKQAILGLRPEFSRICIDHNLPVFDNPTPYSVEKVPDNKAFTVILTCPGKSDFFETSIYVVLSSILILLIGMAGIWVAAGFRKTD